jgi:hypothetical protein
MRPQLALLKASHYRQLHHLRPRLALLKASRLLATGIAWTLRMPFIHTLSLI